MPDSVDSRILKSVQEMHADGKTILAYSVGMHAGLDNSTVSRWFPELAAEITSQLPVGAIKRAEWLSTGWLRQGYAPSFATRKGGSG
jgi:hypothetical protein